MQNLALQIADPFEDLYAPARYKVYWGGRAGCKSWAFADALLVQGMNRKLRIVCAREIQKSIKNSVYALLKDRIEALGIGGKYSISVTEIKGTNGTEIFFEGLWMHIDSIKSLEGADIVWVEEAATVSDDSWKKLIPTIRKSGSEIWVSFNPETKHDPAYQRFVLNPPPNAIVKKVSWRDNPWLTQESMDDRDHLRATDFDEYQHVWEGELRKIAKGAIYGKQIRIATEEKRITSIPYAPGVEVNTFWDLGRNDLMSIIFHQRVGHENRFIDYYESRLEDLPHYAKILQNKPYVYGKHYLPHDGDHIMLGTSTDDSPKGRSRKRILEDLNIKPIEIVPKTPLLQTGIDQTKIFFASCWFDSSKCERLLECLSNYAYKYSEQEEAWTNNVGPKWATNAADAFRQAAQGYNPPSKSKTMEFTSEWA